MWFFRGAVAYTQGDLSKEPLNLHRTFTIPDPASVEEHGRTFTAYREDSESTPAHIYPLYEYARAESVSSTEYYLPNDGVSQASR